MTDAPEVALSPVAGDHEYVKAPLALRTVEFPEQMVTGFGVTDTVGKGLTVTVILLVPVHPEDVPVTVYVIVAAGLAVGFEQLVQLNPDEGDQE